MKKINLYMGGMRHGYWEVYHTNGQLGWKGYYDCGVRVGYWEKYYDDGLLCYGGNYMDGKRVGYWEYSLKGFGGNIVCNKKCFYI